MIQFVSITSFRKRGPSQQLDIENNEINRLVTEFITELNAGQLVLHDIIDGLKEIKSENNSQED